MVSVEIGTNAWSLEAIVRKMEGNWMLARCVIAEQDANVPQKHRLLPT